MAYYTDPNQTKFSLEEPLFEQMGGLPPDENPDEEIKRTPLLRQKKFIIVIIVGFILIVLGLLYLVNAYIQSQKLVQEQAPPENVETEVANPNDPLYRRIKSAQQELKEADPSEQDLIYPTMDYDIYLDEPDR